MLPSSKFRNSALSGCHQLKIHVTGVMLFGKGIYCYLDAGEYPHDSNMTISILLDVNEQLILPGMHKISFSIFTFCFQILSKQEALPPRLHIQLDNTPRENKNQFVLSMLARLVEAGIFDEVYFLYAVIVSN